MNRQLLLESIRDNLVRQEETILFALIERAQFRVNSTIYRPGALGELLGGESLVGYLLRETETIHARMRRYTSPDEHPFYTGLPEPILPALRFDENPLRPNTVNINADIRRNYETAVVPAICEDGDDGQYGSSSVADVSCLQAISRRVHFGKFVAESKFRARPELFAPLIRAADEQGLMERITDTVVERAVLDRVREKARTYGQEFLSQRTAPTLDPEVARMIYADHIIPMNKRVQVAYLLARDPDA
jgi:chorismate mutase